MLEISKTADNLIGVLIELAAARTADPHQLAARLGISRAPVQRLLVTLLTRDLVVRSNGRAPAVLFLPIPIASARSRSRVQRPLHRAVTPVAEQLSADLGETVVFQIIDDRRLIVLVEVFPRRDVALQVRHEIGSRSDIA